MAFLELLIKHKDKVNEMYLLLNKVLYNIEEIPFKNGSQHLPHLILF